MNCSIIIRPMTLADVPLGMRLKAIAGWNQREADWRMLLEAGAGFVALVDGAPVGTATVVTYRIAGVSSARHLSWIGMLLVDPAYRRRGVGTALLRAAIAHARPCGPVYLDATPQGEPLYASLGFKSVGSLVRMGRSSEISAISHQLSAFSFQPSGLSDSMLTDVVYFDTLVFGANRDVILRALLRNAPQYAHYVKHNGKLTGYGLGRPGSDFVKISPVEE
jgi:GNAT superfamily N-acetyltransferase